MTQSTRKRRIGGPLPTGGPPVSLEFSRHLLLGVFVAITVGDVVRGLVLGQGTGLIVTVAPPLNGTLVTMAIGVIVAFRPGVNITRSITNPTTLPNITTRVRGFIKVRATHTITLIFVPPPLHQPPSQPSHHHLHSRGCQGLGGPGVGPIQVPLLGPLLSPVTLRAGGGVQLGVRRVWPPPRSQRPSIDRISLWT
jgi:hypothetical protein